ncbi:MAG: hypothetical protein WBM56_01155 [Robiginitalea sp.]|uniref:hypothetical protein n=1 Tax=Robiginitalea sp. TaxID=1902411 RepID=UPI003C749838
MAFSYNFKHIADFETENRERSKSTVPSKTVVNRTTLQILAGSLLLAVLLIGSWNLDNLFMTELVAASFIWGLISLIRIKSEPNKTKYEKRQIH